MRRRRQLASAALGILVLAPALGACGGEEELQAGTVIQARKDSQFTAEGFASSLTLPLGRLEIATGDPTDKIAAKQTRDLASVDAPSGSTFIPITWQYDAGTFGAVANYLRATDTPTIELIAGGANYRLAAPPATTKGAESFYVLVSGDGQGVELEVDFDGVTQSVNLATGERDAGQAAPLYQLKAPKRRTRSCTSGATFKTDALARLRGLVCKVTPVVTLPYAGGEWAPEGKAWLGVTVTTSVSRYEKYSKNLKSGAIYTPTAAESSFAAGQLEPTTVLDDLNQSACPESSTALCRKVYHLIFEVDPNKLPRQLQVQQTYTQTLFTAWGNAQFEDAVEVTGTIKVPLR